MSFDPDTTPSMRVRRQPSEADVMRDLRAGEGVREVWAPNAVDALRERGVVTVRNGWAILRDRIAKPRPKRSRAKRRPWANARDRDELVRAALPATLRDAVAASGLSMPGARVVLVRLGARPMSTRVVPDARGYRRPVAVWAMP